MTGAGATGTDNPPIRRGIAAAIAGGALDASGSARHAAQGVHPGRAPGRVGRAQGGSMDP